MERAWECVPPAVRDKVGLEVVGERCPFGTHKWWACCNYARAGSTVGSRLPGYASCQSPRRLARHPGCMGLWYRGWRGGEGWPSLPLRWSQPPVLQRRQDGQKEGSITWDPLLWCCFNMKTNDRFLGFCLGSPLAFWALGYAIVALAWLNPEVSAAAAPGHHKHRHRKIPQSPTIGSFSHNTQIHPRPDPGLRGCNK